MKSRSTLVIVCIVGLCLFLGLGLGLNRAWQQDRYQHETYMYPPEILVPKYLEFPPAKAGSDYEIDSKLDLHRSLLVLSFNYFKKIQEYSFDLNLKREVRSIDWGYYSESIYPELPNFYPASDRLKSRDNWGQLGSISYNYDSVKSEWQLWADIYDLPDSQCILDSASNSIRTRRIVSHHAMPSFKDFAIHLDGEVSIRNAAVYTGDNLLGAAEKKRAEPMAFFTGVWTLVVQGEPVLRQRVRNFCLANRNNLYYSPIYGLVRFDYQPDLGSDDRQTVYILKVKASGPNVYRDIKSREDAERTVD